VTGAWIRDASGPMQLIGRPPRPGQRPPPDPVGLESPVELGNRTGPPLTVTEDREGAQRVRLALAGELDLASRGPLEDRLGELAHAGVDVRLDLSRLEFIDSSGLHVLIDAYQTARRSGRQFEVEPTLRPPVLRVVQLIGLDRLLWPSASGSRP
jgi:anti-sigma B factor antagonist